ncbi:MAG: UDP-N-acetylmuramoyl-L-alanyl-D-glutamate--2,6-diaminopimelate ligase [Rickettsiales bacterium]
MLRVTDLLARSPAVRMISGSSTIKITGVAADSREIRQGAVYVAIPGIHANGEDFIPDALTRGAVAVLCSQGYHAVDLGSVTRLASDNPRLALAQLAAAYYQQMPSHIVAVTGTDGKTSTSDFVRQFLEGLGMPAASLGTLGARAERPLGKAAKTATHTTPDPVGLHHLLSDIKEAGINFVAMEASSHGLDQYRLDAVKPEVAVFTTFGRDHLDYHLDEEAYFNAKARLFRELLPEDGLAVLNADQPKVLGLKEELLAKSIKVRTFGHNPEADNRILRLAPTAAGQDIAIDVEGRSWQGTVPLYGAFQIMNILAAMTAVSYYSDSPEAYFSLLPKIKGVTGRLELVAEHPAGAHVFVDYAHTPQALENVLTTIRQHAKGKLHVVFGCGGNRDKGKRPLMGQVAIRLADAVTVTDDNPRHEDPAEIRKEVLAGAPHAREIGDRQEAITTVVQELQARDVLLIAGKGHETTQVIAGETFHFNDAEVARAAVALVRAGKKKEPA